MILSMVPSLFLLITPEVKGYRITRKEKQRIISLIILLTIPLSFLQVPSINLIAINILVICSFIDHKHREIPNIAAVLLTIAVAITAIVKPFDFSLFNSGMAALLYLFFLVACLLGYIGGGDIKILLPIFLLYSNNIFALYIFIFITAVISILTALPLVIKNRTLKVTTPMAISFLISLILTSLILKAI